MHKKLAIASHRYTVALLLVSLSAIFCSIFFGHTLSHEILWRVRLPHTFSAFVMGGLLSLAGVLMQAFVRNPLADPYVLGVSGGAAVAALCSLIFFGVGDYGITLSAWIGSLAVILFIYRLQKQYPTTLILLFGVALATGFSALISALLYVSPNNVLRGMMFWLMGDLSQTQLPYFEGSVLLIGLLISLMYAKELNILIRGEKAALMLGVNTTKVQRNILLLSSLLTATSVSHAGCIGFIGLIVPHILRLSLGFDHRILLPAAVLVGGSLLTFADVFSRWLFFPESLPVGLVMSLLGIPIFIFLLKKTAYVAHV